MRFKGQPEKYVDNENKATLIQDIWM